MKHFLVFFIISLNFYVFSTTTQLFPRILEERKLEDANQEKKLILVGFGNFNDTYIPRFDIFFQKINDFNNYEALTFTSLINYNVTMDQKINITCKDVSSSVEDQNAIIYNCSLRQNYTNLTRIYLNNYNFKFNDTNTNTLNESLSENNIIETYLANQTRDKIMDQTKNLDYKTFYLDNTTLVNKQIVLKGNISLNQTEINNIQSPKLNLSGNIYDCVLSENEIRFNIINNIDIFEHLNGKMIYSSNDIYILIFSNDTQKDLAIYSYENYSYVEIIGFSNFTNSTSDTDAMTTAYFRGTINYLRNLSKYMRFKATVFYSSLRNLEESSMTINATGIKNENETLLKQGLVTYNVSFPDTINKTIQSINSSNIFEFSEDEINYSQIEYLIVDNNSEFLDPTNTKSLSFESIIMGNENVTTTSSSFSFDFTVSGDGLTVDNNNKTISYLNYIPNGTTIRDEINCTVEKKTTTYTITCSPKKDVYTYLRTLRIKVLQSGSRRRLRFLATESNRTFYGPIDSEGVINYDYIEIKRGITKKNNGLSAGAIVGIVFGSIAAIAAVGIAFYCLNKTPANPRIEPRVYNKENSTSNINK